MEKKFLTSKEVIQLLNISQRTLTRKVSSGEFEVRRKKRKLIFPSEQFKPFLNEGESQKETKEEGFKLIEKTTEVLTKQLEEKDKQIQELQKQIKEKDIYHHQQIIQQQALTRQLQDRFLLLDQPQGSQKDQPKKRKKTKKKTKKKETTQPKQKPKQDKQGFWNWFLGK